MKKHSKPEVKTPASGCDEPANHEKIDQMGNVERFYDGFNEWERLERHPIEFGMMKRMLLRYVPEGASVLDVGGGPGRYSIYLSQKGYDVTLVDLSRKHVEQAKRKAKETGVNVRCLKGNALELKRIFPEQSFDAVLCMGPLYHLVEEKDRVKAAEQCIELLKPRGILVVSFISAYAAMIECLKGYPQEVRSLKQGFLRYLEDGRHIQETGKGFTDAYYIDPAKIERFMSQFRLETLRVMAIDGPGTLVEDKLIELNNSDLECWLDIFEAISDRQEVWGSCKHMLYVGRKTE